VVVGIPTNVLGCQNTHSGVGYAGLFIFINNPDSDQGYREYLGVRLSSSLISGVLYDVQFSVSQAERTTHASSDIQVLFSSDSLIFDQNTPILIDPQLQGTPGNYYESYNDWMQVEWTYQATGNESFMYIGNFKNNMNTDTLITFNSSNMLGYYFPSTYYYIDDVQVSTSTLSSNPRIGFKSMLLYPNPFSSVVNLQSHVALSQISVFNIHGEMVLNQKAPFSSIVEIDLSELNIGLYILDVTSVSGQQFREKIVKR